MHKAKHSVDFATPRSPTSGTPGHLADTLESLPVKGAAQEASPSLIFGNLLSPPRRTHPWSNASRPQVDCVIITRASVAQRMDFVTSRIYWHLQRLARPGLSGRLERPFPMKLRSVHSSHQTGLPTFQTPERKRVQRGMGTPNDFVIGTGNKRIFRANGPRSVRRSALSAPLGLGVASRSPAWNTASGAVF